MSPSLDLFDSAGTDQGEIQTSKALGSSKPNGITHQANEHGPGELDASSIQIHLTEFPRDVPALDDPSRLTQRVCTDHMITARWTEATGWQRPELKPYGPLSIMPSANVLQYATTCFEGLKLYRGYDGALRLFRVWRNADRMLLSANRIALPSFPPAEFLKLIVKLCAVDGAKWLPRSQPGRMLYLRPTFIGDDPTLGIGKPKQALLYIILCLMPNMSGDANGIRLLASEEESSGVRAWPGGHGWAKVGANYGTTFVAHSKAVAEGFTQMLWLLRRPDGNTEVTEAGASNFFVVWKTRDGGVEMVTPPLGDRVILDGVTRRSVLELARERLVGGNASGVAPLKVHERPVLMQEIEEAVAEGRLIEAFAVGTAFFVAPISMIRYCGRELAIPMAEGSTGTYARMLKGWLSDIMYGKEKHEWAYIVEEAEQ